MSDPDASSSKEPGGPRFRSPVKLKKIICYAVVLVLFLFATNPSLIPFLPSDVKQSAGNTWSSLFGDVDGIVGTLRLNWASVFKLVAMILLLILITTIAQFILERIRPKSGKGRSGLTMARSAVSYLTALIGIFWGLSIIGVPVGTVFASVGVVALIVGFGAESLVADVVTGVFLVFEDQFNVGDIIEVDGFRGVVDQIGIRTTYVRDAGNNVKIINNSDLRNILNRSRAASSAVTDVSVSYSQDLEKVEKTLADLLPAIREKYPDVFLSDPQYLGVQSLGDSSVVLRIVAEVGEENVFKAPRLLNRELKLGFDKAGVEIPFPQLVVHRADP